MNNKILQDRLATFADELVPYISSDPECNSYRKLHSVYEMLKYGEDGFNEFYDPNWSADDADMTEQEWENFKATAERVLVLN